MECPQCQRSEKQVKAGRNESGSQRYKCNPCGIRYTPEPAQHGYPDEFRLKAVRMYIDGMNLRRIARHLNVSPQSVSNWVNAYVAQLPPAPLPDRVETVEMDELFTYIEEKKSAPTS